MSLFDIIAVRQNQRKRTNFYMPGHIGGNNNTFFKNIFKYDTTEIDCFDDYHKPKGIIKHGEKLLSKTFYSKKSIYLLNGSTSGILAGMSYLFNEKSKVLVSRDCHKSVINGLVVTGANPVYLKPLFNFEIDISLPITLKQIKKAYSENMDACGIVLTYPNYYGVYPENLEDIIRFCKEKGLMVLLDEAHGAHLYFSNFANKLGNYCKADIVISSFHKNLTGLTQTAMLHINNGNFNVTEVRNHVSLVTTTSPSYIFLTSMDYSRKLYNTKGKKILQNTIELASYMQDLLEKHKIQYIKDLSKEYFVDPTKVTVLFPRKYIAQKVYNKLNKHGIFPELLEGRKILFLIKPAHSKSEIKKTVALIRRFLHKRKNEKIIDQIDLYTYNNSGISPRAAFYSSSKWVHLKASIGKISTSTITPYPPGIPTVMPGEKITEEIVAFIQSFAGEIHGVEDGHIQVMR
ncbi:aminotransferase class I/II-fold pyridoxal phosphate-dependent enzyme [Proteinivorax tanatarense]|uniref:Aminotransferase class I/II-fold pyridoxal phosphate-dependent enzyme n=1 Tax=Proteinivorax tanatarense TaxID=1260629 RepID=A0AAU7VM35_9FIRM